MGKEDQLLYLIQNVSFQVYPTNDALSAACSIGHIDMVQLLFDLFSFSNSPLTTKMYKALCAAMTGNHILIIDYLNDHFFKHFEMSSRDRLYLLQCGMKKGSKEFMKWLLNNIIYRLTFEQNWEDLFHTAAQFGNEEVTTWFCDTFPVEKGFITHRAFPFVHVRVLDFLRHKFDFTKTEIFYKTVLSFEPIEGVTYFPFLSYIYESYDVSEDDIRMHNDMILKELAQSNSVRSAIYLIKNKKFFVSWFVRAEPIFLIFCTKD